MLNATQSKNIASTLKYFQALTQGDYYLGTAIAGTWRGKGATILGLGEGKAVSKEGFAAILEGRHPTTGKRLAQRIRKDRRPAVDFTFSVPKSVSLAWAINQDERIVEILRETVHLTMKQDVERLVCHRDRTGVKAGSNDRKKTANLLYADFLHTTARPVDGLVDAQLHVHCVTFNHTTGGNKHYAADLEEVFRQLPSIQAKFHARLARKLQSAGYAVEQVAYEQTGRRKEGWQLKGVSRSTIEKFSRRTAQIEAFAAEHGIQDAKAKGDLGAKTREKKGKETPVEELRREWRSRLTSEELSAFANLKEQGQSKIETTEYDPRLAAAIKYALEHHFYRESTVEKHTVVGTALEHGLTLSPEAVEAALRSDELIERTMDVRGTDREYLTTREVLDAEERMIAFVRESRGTRRQIGQKPHQFRQTFLSDQQRGAINHVLESRDTVIGISGGAGTGKSSTLSELGEAIRSNGRKVFAFAPSTAARNVLIEKEFADAQTVEYLIRNEKLHRELYGQVLLIDEASLMDVRAMNEVFTIAGHQKCRVVLIGDVRQHAGVRRGEACRLLEQFAGLNAARIEEVQRQKGDYKRAIELVSLGSTVIDQHTGLTGMLAGFDMLDRLGKIKEIASEERHDQLADSYLAAYQKGQSTLVVSPTHAEGRAVTEKIRGRLRRVGTIGKEGAEKVFYRLGSLNYTDAEKGNLHSYSPSGMVVQFHQNVSGGFKRGERYHVVTDPEGSPSLQVSPDSAIKRLPIEAADRFEVYRQEEVTFAPGDKIRFTLGGKASDGKRQIANGRIDEVKGFGKAGNIVLKSGMTIDQSFGHFDLGYSSTSHAAQGRDASRTIAAIGSQSLPAVNARQFYVTCSRGKHDLEIYVDDKRAIRRAIRNAGEQLSATELLQNTVVREEYQQRQRTREQRSFIDRVRGWWQQFAERRSAWQPEQKQAMETASPLPQPEIGR